MDLFKAKIWRSVAKLTFIMSSFVVITSGKWIDTFCPTVLSNLLAVFVLASLFEMYVCLCKLLSYDFLSLWRSLIKRNKLKCSIKIFVNAVYRATRGKLSK